jgi:uncharacterized protein (TIGR03086 family)
MTVDWITLQKTAHDEFARRVEAVADWDAPTPDTDWKVRDLVRHVTREQQWVPLLLEGGDPAEAENSIEPLGDDLVEAWHRWSNAATAAWREADPHAEVRLSADVVPVHEYLAEQVADVTIHTWDLARAVGADEELDDALVEAVWGVFEPQKDALEASGLFASPVPVGDDAPLRIRLLALTGRDAR